jgi:hypothetical protein
MRNRIIFILLTALTGVMLIAGTGFFLVVRDLPHIPSDLRNLVTVSRRKFMQTMAL